MDERRNSYYNLTNNVYGQSKRTSKKLDKRIQWTKLFTTCRSINCSDERLTTRPATNYNYQLKGSRQLICTLCIHWLKIRLKKSNLYQGNDKKFNLHPFYLLLHLLMKNNFLLVVMKTIPFSTYTINMMNFRKKYI